MKKAIRIWWQRLERGWADEDYYSAKEKAALPWKTGDVIPVSRHELNAIMDTSPGTWLTHYDKWRTS